VSSSLRAWLLRALRGGQHAPAGRQWLLQWQWHVRCHLSPSLLLVMLVVVGALIMVLAMVLQLH